VLRRCADELPDRVEVHDLLGHVLKQTGNLEEAVVSFQRAVELAPDEVQPQVALALCLDALGRSEDADAAIRALGEHGAKDPAVRALVQELLQRRG
jgi:Flp pilus assembly protein TadD